MLIELVTCSVNVLGVCESRIPFHLHYFGHLVLWMHDHRRVSFGGPFLFEIQLHQCVASGCDRWLCHAVGPAVL